MDSFKELLQSKGYKIEYGEDTVIIDSDNNLNSLGIYNLINRMSKSGTRSFEYSYDGRALTLKSLDDESKQFLSELVSNDEHTFYSYPGLKKYDLKVGYSCDNNCVHCVIKPNLRKEETTRGTLLLIDTDYGLKCTFDLEYKDIVKVFNSTSFKDKDTIVITGGEPFIREDIIKIVRWLYYNRPDVSISFQTNGRKLKNRKIVNSLRRYTRSINFAIALHSNIPAIHGAIVNNKGELEESFYDTVEGIKNVVEVFGNDFIRSETVISRKNVGTLFDTVKYIHKELGLKIIGMSYPHLDGFDKPYIESVAPSFDEVGEQFAKINEYVQNNPELMFMYEDMPICVLYKHIGEGKILLQQMERTFDITINSSGSESENYQQVRSMCKHKYDKCKICAFACSCEGVWHETRDINEKCIHPIWRPI